MRRNNWANLLLLATTLAATLAVLEFATRAIFADVTTTGDNTSYFARRWYAANPPRRNRLGFRKREFAPASASASASTASPWSATRSPSGKASLRPTG